MQHVCSVIIFICCFTGIFQERVAPVSVVSWASIGTVLGWVLRDYWVGQEEAIQAALDAAAVSSKKIADEQALNNGPLSPVDPLLLGVENVRTGLGISGASLSRVHSRATSLGSMNDGPTHSSATTGHPTGAETFSSYSYYPPYESHGSSLSPRNQERLATAKSALLIYCALLGLSPILKSLTKSTSPDSIWAISSWLMIINVFTYDYGAGVEAK